MRHEDWLARWRDGRIGWHQQEVTPLLRQHWPALDIPPATRVLVPLCGKSLDLAWLAAQGLDVLGVELSELAVQQFFDEQGLQPERQQTEYGLRYRGGGVEIVVGDILALDAAVFAGCGAIYDRAALIALSPGERARYTRHVYAGLPRASRGLLLTLEYEQALMSGPPYAVHAAEVQHLLAGDWQVQLLQRRASTGPGRADDGLAFDAAVYQLQRR